MKICCISDLHGDLIEIDNCDTLCICGDIIPLDIQSNYQKSILWLETTFKNWLKYISCNNVLIVPGNHDYVLSILYNNQRINDIENEFTKQCNKQISILIDKEVVIDNIKFYGTPWCKIFGSWSFMELPERLEEKYNQIPNDLDVLLTHDVTYGYGDTILEDTWGNKGKHVGNQQLTDAVLRTKPRYFFHGHIHSSERGPLNISDTIMYNASIKNEEYIVVNDPIYLDILPLINSNNYDA